MKVMTTKYNPRIIQSNREQITSFSDKKSYSALTGISFSTKNDRLIYFESSLERDFAKLLEFNQSVIDYLDHPITIGYTSMGKDYSYTPDFIVEFSKQAISNKETFLGERIRSRKWLVELKPKKYLTDMSERDAIKYEAAKELCKIESNEFKLFSEEIRTDYLTNIKRLLAYKQENDNETLVNKILNRLNEKSLRFAELTNSFQEGERGHVVRQIWISIAKGNISCDLNAEINNNTILNHDSEV